LHGAKGKKDTKEQWNNETSQDKIEEKIMIKEERIEPKRKKKTANS